MDPDFIHTQFGTHVVVDVCLMSLIAIYWTGAYSTIMLALCTLELVRGGSR